MHIMDVLFNKSKEFIRSKPVIAIIGGAGPDAAIDLQIKLSLAMKNKLDISFDQEHYRVIVDNNIDIPDRNKALISNNLDPLFVYINSTKILEKMGGDILTISCNSAHAYFDDIKKVTGMKVVNMIEETATFLYNYHPKIKKVGLLSTSATIQRKLYHEAFDKYQVEVVTPDINNQNNVMQAIYGIKAGFVSKKQLSNNSNKSKLYNVYQHVSRIKSSAAILSPKDLLLNTIRYFENLGIKAIILGCTEIPLVINRKRYKGYCTLIDPTEILANAAVDYAISFNKKN
jgi:aspartate racemase